MAATVAVVPPSTFLQSPSVEDLLSARSKRSGPVQSFYSNITTATELDLPEAARLAMREEAANGIWSPSMASNISEDDAQTHFQVDEAERDCGLETPNMSESQYSSGSRSPSMASVKVAAIIKGGAASTIELAMAGVGSASTSGTGADESTSPRRLLNSRNLQINTTLSAVRAYPQQLVTPGLTTERAASVEGSPMPLTSRSLPAKMDPTTASVPSAPLSAIPLHVTRPRRRSSLDSLSTLASPTIADDETLGLNQASLQRMQSFLGPKMKHISPAPWNNENIADGASDYTSEGSFWNDDDPEIGSVQLATKAPRSRSIKEALGMATSANIIKPETGTLKGLGLAMAAAAAAGSPTSRPSLSSERSAKARTMTASSDTSMYVGKASKLKGFLSRSESRDIMASPPPPVPVNAVMTVSNITRSKSPEPIATSLSHSPFLDLAVPQAVAASSTGSATSSGSVTPSMTPSPSRRRSLSNAETAVSKLASASAALSSSTPADASNEASAIARIAELPLAPHTIEDPDLTGAIARKRPPLLRQDTSATSTTLASSDSHSVLPPSGDIAGAIPIPTNGLKLVSLDVARSRERAKSPTQTPSSPNPPLSAGLPSQPGPAAGPATKTIKSKKSGFLKLFKYKDDASAPAVPRGSSDDAQPTVALAGNRSVSNPTDFRRGEALKMPPPRGAQGTGAAAPMTKARSDTGDSSTLVIKQPSTAGSSDAPRRPNASAPPSVALVQPSPDLNERQAPFPVPNFPLPPPPSGLSKAKRTFVESQDGLAPSLSLRPVSMMFSSMPQAFLADLQAAELKKASLAAAMTATSPTSLSSESLSSPTAARTPDTPSFVFFDPDNVVTPPANAPQAPSKAPFGLPTPPHSASSARTGYPGLPKPPSSPSLAQHESAHAAVSAAAYRARILVLEKQVAVLQARLASAGQAGSTPLEAEKPPVLSPEVESPTTAKTLLNKTCEKCGCTCRASNVQSVLSRPRALIGNGNSFSNARRD